MKRKTNGKTFLFVIFLILSWSSVAPAIAQVDMGKGYAEQRLDSVVRVQILEGGHPIVRKILGWITLVREGRFDTEIQSKFLWR